MTQVEDTGVGIMQQDQCKIFKFFGKLTDTKKINEGGMGIGLTISKMIVQQFRGFIQFESEYGRGSRFTFLIPLRGSGFDLIPGNAALSATVTDSPIQSRVIVMVDN